MVGPKRSVTVKAKYVYGVLYFNAFQKLKKMPKASTGSFGLILILRLVWAHLSWAHLGSRTVATRLQLPFPTRRPPSVATRPPSPTARAGTLAPCPCPCPCRTCSGPHLLPRPLSHPMRQLESELQSPNSSHAQHDVHPCPTPAPCQLESELRSTSLMNDSATGQTAQLHAEYTTLKAEHAALVHEMQQARTRAPGSMGGKGGIGWHLRLRTRRS
jgi:hypothetical protein